MLCAYFPNPKFMDEMIKLKERYGQFAPMSFNILRFQFSISSNIATRY